MTNEAVLEKSAAEPATYTVGEAWRNLVQDPAMFIRYWNYKGAVLSGLVRAPIFLVTYLVAKEGLKLAIGAALVQFGYRFLFAGLSGALIQSFRRVEPPWKALLTIMLALPAFSHFLEFCFQSLFAYLTGTTNHTDEAIIRSICFTIISALFTLFIMRRNVLIVGEEESKSLLHDVLRLPFLIFDFIAFVPNEIASMFRRGAYLSVILGIAGFGLFSQMLVWAVTNRAFWTYGGGKDLGIFKYWGVDGITVLILAIALSLLVPTRSSLHRTKH